jgi:hypothetical protein
MRRLTGLSAVSLVLVLAASACSSPKTGMTRTYNFRALGGISMGAIGASFLTGHADNHKKVDALAALGGPIDVAYFLGSFERMQMGGFCSNTQLTTLSSTNPAGMNNPEALTCSKSPTIAYEKSQDFNNWSFTDNGGDFDRSAYLDIFYDLSVALGNPLFYNPNSAVYPVDHLPTDPDGSVSSSICAPGAAKVFNKANGNAIYNKEFNPDGSHDVITFCDGQEPIYYCNDANLTPVDYCQRTDMTQSDGDFATAQCGAAGFQEASSTRNADLYYARKGHFNPCYPHHEAVSFGLAVDYNGNGKRDYFEPIVLNGHERFEDVGSDGCADDKEDGKGGCTASGQTGDPNHDNFDFLTNPAGTQGNWLHDEGEAFEDTGLDGVAGTGDFGEGNGKYDDGPSRQNWLAWDFRQNYRKWSPQEQKSINVYAEGGIRDVFNFGLSSDMLSSSVREKYPEAAHRYLDFSELPALPGSNWAADGFDVSQVDYSKMAPNVFLRYGNPNATLAQIRLGDGDHVGVADQTINRTRLFLGWVGHVWDPVLGPQQPAQGEVPPQKLETPYLNSLGAKRNFKVALPPGYDLPENKDVRYPVVTIGHGYGMDVEGMATAAVLFDALMQSGELRPMILVFPSGHCCYQKDGMTDCRDQDDTGTDLDRQGWQMQCHRGNFYADSQGVSPGKGVKYGESLFEQLDWIDAHYRTLKPKTIPMK